MRKPLCVKAALAIGLAVSGVWTGGVRADVKLASVFTDHMVLQRDKKVPFWGWADPGEAVKVTAGDAKGDAKADDNGKWTISLDPMKASDQPMDVTISGKNSITLHDVLVGDVWVCSGQSNMEFQFGGGSFGFGGAHDFNEEVAKADRPMLRLFIVTKKTAYDPQPTCGGTWLVSTPATAPKFSAVGYFFGADIQADQKVPVGLIGTYWGGQTSQSFTSLDALKANPDFASLVKQTETSKANLQANLDAYKDQKLPAWQKEYDKWKQDSAAAMSEWQKAAKAAQDAGQPAPAKFVPKVAPRKPSSPDNDPTVPSVLFNGMINPIVPYAIKGAIWYQGESNAGNPVQYQALFPAMITDWRKHWDEGDFPFIWVQLANYMAREKDPVQTSGGWPGLREAQTMTLKLPNSGQAVIEDIGQADDIHPKDKHDVGHRLALAARHVAYGEDVVYSGPMFDSLKVEGDKAVVSFKDIGGGLTIAAAPSTRASVPQAEPASMLKGFTIAGDDKKFYWADASIDGDTVVVHSDQVPKPVAVRYGWANNPEVNLYNKDGLPACPFRSDDWSAQPMPAKAK